MNRKGLTLVELLGAIVIFGLMISLASVILSLIRNASEDIDLNARANSEALFIDLTIKNELKAFAPTNYSLCDGLYCVIFEHHFSYTFDPVLEDIILTTYNPPLVHQIEINQNVLFINGIAIEITDFTLGNDSSILISENVDEVYVVITLDLVAENNKVYTFTTSYNFTILDIPVS